MAQYKDRQDEVLEGMNMTIKLRKDIISDTFAGHKGTYKTLSLLSNEGYTNDEIKNIRNNAQKRWHGTLGSWTYKVDAFKEGHMGHNRVINRKEYTPAAEENWVAPSTPQSTISADTADGAESADNANMNQPQVSETTRKRGATGGVPKPGAKRKAGPNIRCQAKTILGKLAPVQSTLVVISNRLGKPEVLEKTSAYVKDETTRHSLYPTSLQQSWQAAMETGTAPTASDLIFNVAMANIKLAEASAKSIMSLLDCIFEKK